MKNYEKQIRAISKEKQKLFSRIKRLGGQIMAVEWAVADGDEYAEIPAAGGNSLRVNSLMAEILEDHARRHIAHRAVESPGVTGRRFDLTDQGILK
jgi:DNA-binding FrmR family transcriptional regulator